jgi:hypothetical protein
MVLPVIWPGFAIVGPGSFFISLPDIQRQEVLLGKNNRKKKYIYKKENH